MSSIIQPAYWDETYRKRNQLNQLVLDGYKGFLNRQIYDVLGSVNFSNKKIVEVGGAGSAWMILLASKFTDSVFVAIDYSKEGCTLLDKYSRDNNIDNIHIVCTDFFDCQELEGKFDVLYSFGVVEHFTDLSSVIVSFRKYLNDTGKMVTFIPNMTGIIGKLTKIFNKDVYDIHILYDREALVAGHVEAGMKVLRSGYLGSSGFGVLSSCFKKQRGIKYQCYKYLTRISKLIWAFEYRFFPLPSTKLFAPYIYVVAEPS